MLRGTRFARMSRYGFGSHTVPTQPKYLDKPGLWSVSGGPPKDTLARRVDFYRLLFLHKIGRMTAPFKTKRVVWAYRKFTTRLWKGTVLTLVAFILLLSGNIWVLMVFHAYQMGPSTPVMERKVREHRVSKQILEMVRGRETELARARETQEAERTLQQRDALSAQRQQAPTGVVAAPRSS
jgi:hypothetical protein